jgi:hypothetical protein
MRAYLAFFSLLLIPSSVSAQIDPGIQAAQDAQQAAQQSQQAAMQAMQDAQNSQISTPPGPCCIAWTAPPKFSVKPGKYSGPLSVKITDTTRGAVIYYSTDGWTPTVDNSPRYRGPVAINGTTTLQAIAIAPYSMRSIVTSAQYTIAGTPGSSSTPVATTATPGTPSNLIPVPLVFDEEVTSKTASVATGFRWCSRKI